MQTRVGWDESKQAFACGTSCTSALPTKEHACERAEVASAGDLGVVLFLFLGISSFAKTSFKSILSIYQIMIISDRT